MFLEEIKENGRRFAVRKTVVTYRQQNKHNFILCIQSTRQHKQKQNQEFVLSFLKGGRHLYRGKKKKIGSIFVFIRFKGVRDTTILENEMCRVRCEHFILKVNIAKYQK